MAQQAALRMWTPPGLPGVTLFQAEHIRQKFARHSHDEYALGVITRGALGFDYRGGRHLAGAGEVNVAVPGEAHTGQPALGDDWSYRMFYIQPALMGETAGQLGSRNAVLPFFEAGVIRDRKLAGAIVRFHIDLEREAVSQLEAQSRLLALLGAWIRRHAQARPAPARAGVHATEAARVREFLDACWNHKPALDDLAAAVGLSPFQLLRAFTRQYGLPPHAYLVQRQVREAKRLLAGGMAIAHVAAAAGFADQSHLNRHFKRILGVTPGRYRTSPVAAP